MASTQVRSVRTQFPQEPCSDELPGSKGSAPFEATQLDWSEARANDQAQREVWFGDLASLTFGQQVRIAMSAL